VKELQALVTGMIAGALMRQTDVAIDVSVPADDEGNYLPEVHVRGRSSGEELVVKVDAVNP
jgi:predicted HAD superfamily phosphohydrolase